MAAENMSDMLVYEINGLSRRCQLQLKKFEMTLKSPTSTGLKGGSPRHVIEQEITSRVKDIKENAPITSFQMLVGIFAFPFQKYLLFNNGINYRMITGFACYGSPFDVCKRIYGLYTYQQPLEKNYKEFHSILKWKIGLTLVAGFMFTDSPPFSLFPIYEHSIRWTWAFTTDSKPIQFNGYLSIPPILLPIALAFLESSFTECFLGMGISLATLYILDLKRGSERALDYVLEQYEYYQNLVSTLLK
jgi:hypothetical protein